MVAVCEVEAHGVGEVKIDLVNQSMPFPKLAQHFFFFILKGHGNGKRHTCVRWCVAQ